jgi:hypothetical protein
LRRFAPPAYQWRALWRAIAVSLNGQSRLLNEERRDESRVSPHHEQPSRVPRLGDGTGSGRPASMETTFGRRRQPAHHSSTPAVSSAEEPSPSALLPLGTSSRRRPRHHPVVPPPSGFQQGGGRSRQHRHGYSPQHPNPSPDGPTRMGGPRPALGWRLSPLAGLRDRRPVAALHIGIHPL